MNKKCKRCGRVLKTEESKERGFGEVCYEKYLNQNKSGKLIVLTNKDRGNTM